MRFFSLCLTLILSLATVLATAQTFSEGEVRKINKDTQKITLKHGPLANLDMPAMTMVFGVSDPTVLDSVTVGDKVQFVAEKINSSYTVTTLRKAP
jgi:Cu(I)/Ag(I) efflux system protein CusF